MESGISPPEEHIMVDVLEIKAGKQIEMVWTHSDEGHGGCW